MPARWALSSASPISIASVRPRPAAADPRVSRSASVSPSRYSSTRERVDLRADGSGSERRRRRRARRCAGDSATRWRAPRARSARAAAGRRRRGVEHFDGDGAIEPRVAGAIDLAHAACANERKDFIAPSRMPCVRATAGPPHASPSVRTGQTRERSGAQIRCGWYRRRRGRWATSLARRRETSRSCCHSLRGPPLRS